VKAPITFLLFPFFLFKSLIALAVLLLLSHLWSKVNGQLSRHFGVGFDRWLEMLWSLVVLWWALTEPIGQSISRQSLFCLTTLVELWYLCESGIALNEKCN
jgi:hypothetical protein